jgi:uroporphyrinogen-III synthase
MARGAMKIVTTREHGRNEPLSRWLPKEAQVDEEPLTTTKYVNEATVANDVRSVAAFGSHHALVVTSARSERYATTALTALSRTGEVFSVGPSTTNALIERGITVSVQATGASNDLVRPIIRGPVLVLRGTALCSI